MVRNRMFVRPYITLDLDQMAQAHEVTRRREALALKWGRKHGNNLKTMPEGLQLRGVQAEIAARVYMEPIHWHAVSEAQFLDDLPDLESRTLKVDCKSIGNPDHQLIAYKVHPDRAYLLVDCSAAPAGFWLCGWLWGKELMSRPKVELQSGRPCWCAPQDSLRDPAHLRNLYYAEQLEVMNAHDPRSD